MPAIIAAVGSVGVQTVDMLNRNQVYKAQIKNLDIQNKLNTLTQQQKSVLDRELLAAKTDSERMKILIDATTDITKEGVSSSSEILQAAVKARGQQNLITAVMIIAGLGLLATTLYLIKQNKI